MEDREEICMYLRGVDDLTTMLWKTGSVPDIVLVGESGGMKTRSAAL